MTILVCNAGSSSLKFRLYTDDPSDEALVRGNIRRFGEDAVIEWSTADDSGEERADAPDHGAATRWMLDWLDERDECGPFPEGLRAVGHRVVHGGRELTEPVFVDEGVRDHIRLLQSLAPLHNRAALATLDAVEDWLARHERAPGADGPDSGPGAPAVPMAASFDTSFHRDMPERARRYAIPREWTEREELVRYGFHGLAHRWMWETWLERSGRTAGDRPPRAVTLQLGQGCSAAAIEDGRTLDTSMGATPLEGLVMVARCGDVDPGVMLHLLAHSGLDAVAVEDALNHRSGLVALTDGRVRDMEGLLALVDDGDEQAEVALDTFCVRARKYLSAYLSLLEGGDAVVFGGGIGEHSPLVRRRVCSGMAWAGIELDEGANETAVGNVARISTEDSRVEVWTIPVDEEAIIARDVRALLDGRD